MLSKIWKFPIRNELIRFIVAGIGSNIINFIFYVLFFVSGASIVVASVIGYLAGIINSYYLGKLWVFNRKIDIVRLAMIRFIVVYGVSGIGMTAIIDFLYRTQAWDFRVSWFFGAFFAFANNYLGSKWIVFKRRETKNAS